MRGELITTFLEMNERPSIAVTPPHRSGMLLRLDPPTVGFYRYLYDAVGRRWGWLERAAMTDEALGDLLADDRIDVFVLYLGGVPAGFFELDRRIDHELHLAHFGLVSEFIGRGLGKWLLAAAVEAAWDHEPVRVWVSTTNRDHPKGLMTYQWAGFEAYDSRREDG